MSETNVPSDVALGCSGVAEPFAVMVVVPVVLETLTKMPPWMVIWDAPENIDGGREVDASAIILLEKLPEIQIPPLSL